MNNRERVDAIIEQIHQMMVRPGGRPLNPRELKAREERRRSMATSARMAGITLRQDYR